MRTRTSLIFLVGAAGAALGAAFASRRLLSLVGAMTERPLWGYGASLRSSQVAPEDLLRRRSTADEQSEAARELLGRLVERIKSRYDQDAASGRKEPPAVDILVISGGGDWGAFGAGFLKGWQKVPSYHPLAKPEFDAVTGVSTGTLIAPFAFLGDEQSIEQIVNMYRNPKEGLGEAARISLFLAGQHFVRRGAWTGARDTRPHHRGHALPDREGGR